MNNRSKSEKIVSKNTSFLRKRSQTPLEAHLQQINSTLTQQLDDVHERIEASKPIILTIYDKVKKKQAQFQEKIALETEKAEKGQILIKQYQQLHGEGLKIMRKNGILDEFKGLSNYRNASAKQLVGPNKKQEYVEMGLCQHKSMKALDQINKENIYQVENCRSIVNEYRSLRNEKQGGSAGTVHISAEQIYARYKSKLDGQSNRGDSTLNRVRRLSKEIDKDMEELKMRKCQSSLILKNKNSPKPPIVTMHEKKDKKTYFLELQRKKLARM